MNRREFTTFCGAATISSYLGNSTYIKATESANSNKCCIMVYLSGGISALESWIPRVNVPVEIRSVNGAIDTKSGYQLGANFPKLASISHLLSPVHSLGHKDNNHNSGNAYMVTGVPAFTIQEGQSAKEPSFGSLVSYKTGTNNVKNGIPNFVKIDRVAHDSSSWLGASFIGFEANEGGIKNLQINVSEEQFIRRNKMVEDFESLSDRDDYYFKEWSKLRSQARDIVTGSAAQAFNLKNESQEVLNRYNVDKSPFGKSCLLAKRLVENGSKFITISNGNWDFHNDIAKNFDNKAPELDIYLTNLILDLEAVGRLKDTLIVINTEFSRTSRINISAGRDHQSSVTGTMLAGSVYGGRVIGEADEHVMAPKNNPFKPEDLLWTILNHFDIPKNYTIVDNLKRPRHIVSDEAKIII